MDALLLTQRQLNQAKKGAGAWGKCLIEIGDKWAILWWSPKRGLRSLSTPWAACSGMIARKPRCLLLPLLLDAEGRLLSRGAGVLGLSSLDGGLVVH